jgi:hypothetical protein
MYIFIGISVVTLLMSYFIWQQWQIYKKAQKLIESGKEIVATVTDIILREGESKSYYQAEVEFDYFGKIITAKDPIYHDKRKYEIDDEISIYYDGNDPSKIWIKGNPPQLARRMFFLLLFVYFVVVITISIIFSLVF